MGNVLNSLVGFVLFLGVIGVTVWCWRDLNRETAAMATEAKRDRATVIRFAARGRVG